MTEDDVVETLRVFISSKFPKVCPKCHRRFNSLADYLQNTTHAGKPVSYDAESGDWKPFRPVGTLSYANCSCGTTLAISSRGMKLIMMWRLMGWARKETRGRNISVEELLTQLRYKIDKKVLPN